MSEKKKRKPFLLSCPAAVFLSFQKQKKYVWTSNSSFTTFPNQYLKASITFESSHEKQREVKVLLRSSSSKTFKLAADLSLKFGKARHAAPRRSLCSVLIFLPLRDLVIISGFLSFFKLPSYWSVD